MIDADALHRAYVSERNRLVDHFMTAKSEAFKEKYATAIVLVDACAAALPYFSECGKAITAWSTKRLDELTERSNHNVASLEDALETIKALPTETQKENAHAIDLVISATKLSQESTERAINVQGSQVNFLFTVCQWWFECLDDVYRGNSSAFRERIDLIMSFVASKLPGVGQLAELLTLAAELYAANKKKAISADEHMASIEHFCDTAQLWLVGAFTFVAQIKHLGNLISTPSAEEVMELLDHHFESIRAGESKSDA